MAPTGPVKGRPDSRTAQAAELMALRSEIDALRETVQALASEVRDLKTSLGA